MASEAEPRTRRSRLGLGLLAVAAAILPALWILNRFVPPPAHSGLADGRLRACPDSPNCVNSEPGEIGDEVHRIDPLPFTGTAEGTRLRLKQIVATVAGARLVEERPDYLRYEFRTPICRFVDDVEFRLDSTANVVHVRSASRLGYSDLGANRRRIENLRRLLAG